MVNLERAGVAVALPPQSRLAGRYAAADFADAYAAALPPNAPHDIDVLARELFSRPPPWFVALMALRDTAVSLVGLKTSRRIRAALEAENAERIDFFRVIDRGPDEVILGERDRHLDFQASVLVRPTPGGGRELVATTVVQCHGALGRLYIAVIAPFHRMIIRTNLQALVGRLGGA